MSLTIGDVAIDQDDGTETITPGLAADLYLGRKAVTRIPDPNIPKRCEVTAQVSEGEASIPVDSSAAYLVGDVLGSIDYVSPVPVGGRYPARSFELRIGAIPDGTHLVLTDFLPDGCSIPSGTLYGFQGTDEEWEEAALPQMVKVRTSLAELAVADATALIGFAPFAISQALTANATGTSGTTATDTLLQAALGVGEWIVTVEGKVTCSGVGGVKVGLAFTGTASIREGHVAGAGADALTWLSANHPTLGTPVGAFSAAAGGERMFRLSATLTVTAAGVVKFQYASVTNTQTSTVIAGTRLTASRATLV